MTSSLCIWVIFVEGIRRFGENEYHVNCSTIYASMLMQSFLQELDILEVAWQFNQAKIITNCWICNGSVTWGRNYQQISAIYVWLTMRWGICYRFHAELVLPGLPRPLGGVPVLLHNVCSDLFVIPIIFWCCSTSAVWWGVEMISHPSTAHSHRLSVSAINGGRWRCPTLQLTECHGTQQFQTGDLLFWPGQTMDQWVNLLLGWQKNRVWTNSVRDRKFIA